MLQMVNHITCSQQEESSFAGSLSISAATTERLLRNYTKNVLDVQFQNYDCRWRSFISWDNVSPISGARLAEAGFYFIGPGDRVKCYMCKKILIRWTAGDVPWVEHQNVD